MISRFFIDRPIFASVLSIVITIAGIVSLFVLPVAQYPEITPPTVQVSCTYPGASAGVVADTVAAPIEQQVNGVENMLYMSSSCTNDGAYNLTVTFKLGTNLDMAQVLVQNRVSMATPVLPAEVKAAGVTTKKKSPNVMLVVNLLSPDGRYDQLYLSNYATIQIKDELARIEGVGDVLFWGQQDYSMRVWLDPEKLASINLTTSDVIHSLQEQNVQVAAGQIGQPPTERALDFQFTVNTLGRLTTSEEFGEIILKSGSDGQITRVRDVARIELGAKNRDQSCTLDGKPSVGLAVFQLPGSNALATADRIRGKMVELKERFPDGLDYAIVYDTTPFIRESIDEVVHALRDAFILVAVVVLVFLQSWRTTIIPLVAVPVSLVGTFAVMTLLGFSLNNLSLLGLVLAIGVVVDDAIVVVENVERWIEKGLSPKEASYKSMEEVTVAVIAIAFGLSAVFIPVAFIAGITGQFYRQFALTIATSTLISAFNSLTLSPALAAIILKPRPAGGHGASLGDALPRLGIVVILGLLAYLKLTPYLAPLFGVTIGSGHAEDHGAATSGGSAALLWTARLIALAVGCAAGWFLAGLINGLLAGFFRGFNRAFAALTAGYARAVRLTIRGSVPVLVVFGGLLYATYFGLKTVPTGFIPSQDKGYLLMNIQLPDAASLDRTRAVVAKLDTLARERPGVRHTVALAGQSSLLAMNGSNLGSLYVILDDFEHRHAPELYSDRIAADLRRLAWAKIPEAEISVFGAPPVDGLGTAGGFKIMVQDRAGHGLQALAEQTDDLVGEARDDRSLAGVFSMFRANVPQIYVDIDRSKCKSMGVALSDVFNTLQTNLGAYYVNDFNRFGRTWQVNAQAESPFRSRPEDVARLHVRNASGDMVPLGTIAGVRDVTGPMMITRYNMYPAAPINGVPAPGRSSGEAIATMERLSDVVMARGMTTEWTELTYMEILAGNTAALIFPLCVLFVFLTHSAEYESWALPLAIILIAPLSISFALLGVSMAGIDNNIFVQIGFVVLIGLACKNAVLIVEFAKHEQDHGKSRREAAIEASRLRLRPILMTSFAFILGVVPLALAKGAGAEMRIALGIAVFAGMIGVTACGIFFTPVFYNVITWVTERRTLRTNLTSAAAETPSNAEQH
ncbi:MAG: efflux RND transporter permease subunit [Phycisphaerae bacterium]|nr:efflux RND transporter permease subunit [Phycisphaerae bacterium]